MVWYDVSAMKSTQETAQFYSTESAQYSRKRYEGPLISYSQYIFRTRLNIVENILVNLLPDLVRKGQVLLFDIGCADGSVIRRLDEVTGKNITSIDAIDIAPGMIDQAQKQTHDSRFKFYLRGNEDHSKKYSIVSELGVYVANLDTELKYVSTKLSPNGYFILGIALKNSIEARIRRKRESNVDHLFTYPVYKQILEAAHNNNFEIVSKEPYGLFIPKLWAFPGIALPVQKMIDSVIRMIPGTADLFHETVFVFKKVS